MTELSIAQRREVLEKPLYRHSFATLSSRSKGRLCDEQLDETRTSFERDGHRILHSRAFRRLRHKTQVFFFPNNDHICTRLEHSLQVSSVAQTIARCLGLNVELVDAIAKGHDLGHGPFGHHGEEVLSRLCRNHGLGEEFHHELHGLRVAQKLAVIPGRTEETGAGLNLTFEVCDGIVSHYGEKQERSLVPNRAKTFDDLPSTVPGQAFPATLEGCVVRLADRVAYLGRDFEDAIMAGMVKRDELPPEIKRELGDNNGSMIRKMVSVIVKICFSGGEDVDRIEVSEEVHEAMEALLEFNIERIYENATLGRYKKHVEHLLELVWEDSLAYLKSPEGTNFVYDELDRFRTKEVAYPDATKPEQIVLDFVAGMTDNYALRAFDELFRPKAIV